MASPDHWSESSASQSTSSQSTTSRPYAPSPSQSYTHSRSPSYAHARRDSATLTQPDGADKIYNPTAPTKSSGKSSKTGWMRQVKSWIAVSEPSAQAIKSQRRETYKRHGLHLGDPDAAAKMHLPIGVLPRGATTSTSGPTPEKKLRRECKERPRLGDGGVGGGGRKHTSSSHSISSGYSSGAASNSSRRGTVIAPW